MSGLLKRYPPSLPRKKFGHLLRSLLGDKDQHKGCEITFENTPKYKHYYTKDISSLSQENFRIPSFKILAKVDFKSHWQILKLTWGLCLPELISLLSAE